MITILLPIRRTQNIHKDYKYRYAQHTIHISSIHPERDGNSHTRHNLKLPIYLKIQN